MGVYTSASMSDYVYSVYLVFSIRLFSIANLFAVRYLWPLCNEDKCCVVTHHVADNRVPWLVYVRTYCVSIATLNRQNKRSRLLYLGDAQITREVCRVREENEKEETVEILLSFPLSASFCSLRRDALLVSRERSTTA